MSVAKTNQSKIGRIAVASSVEPRLYEAMHLIKLHIIITQRCHFSGLLVMTIGLKKMSCRTMVAIGGALFVIAHIVSGLATDIGVLYLSHGVVSG